MRGLFDKPYRLRQRTLLEPSARGVQGMNPSARPHRFDGSHSFVAGLLCSP